MQQITPDQSVVTTLKPARVVRRRKAPPPGFPPALLPGFLHDQPPSPPSHNWELARELSRTHSLSRARARANGHERDESTTDKGVREQWHRVLLATNVAETSITVDDVAVVVDLGRVNFVSYDAEAAGHDAPCLKDDCRWSEPTGGSPGECLDQVLDQNEDADLAI